MANILYLAYAAVLAVLFMYVLRLPKAPKLPRALLLLVIAPLFYGNCIIGIGFMVGEGELLRWLNVPRFIFHVIAAPLICLMAFELAREFGVPVAGRPAAKRALWWLSAALIIAGAVQELGSLHLVPKAEFGTLRYAHPVPAPPLGPSAAIFFTTAAGFLIWRKAGWPLLFIACLLMLLSAGIPPKLFGQLPGNAGEIIFMAGFMLGLKRLAADGARA